MWWNRSLSSSLGALVGPCTAPEPTASWPIRCIPMFFQCISMYSNASAISLPQLPSATGERPCVRWNRFGGIYLLPNNLNNNHFIIAANNRLNFAKQIAWLDFHNFLWSAMWTSSALTVWLTVSHTVCTTTMWPTVWSTVYPTMFIAYTSC